MKTTINNKVLHKYEKASSILKKVRGGAWTINLDKFNLDDISIIVYETSKKVYRIDTEKAKLRGWEEILGGEKKLVVPLYMWEELKKEKPQA